MKCIDYSVTEVYKLYLINYTGRIICKLINTAKIYTYLLRLILHRIQ